MTVAVATFGTWGVATAIFLALVIATVKGSLVAGFFMLDLAMWWREFVDQWPPGTPIMTRKHPRDIVEPHTQLSRVADLKADLFWTGVGSTGGHVVRTWLIVWWMR